MMNKEQIEAQEPYVNRLYQILSEASFSGFNKLLEELNQMSDKDASIILMRGFLRYYKASKADYIATWMEKAIHFNPNWAQVDGLDNPLLKSAFISGSKDLYDCYIEEVDGLDDEWFEEALKVAVAFNQNILNQCEPVLVGLHYNSGIMDNGRKSLDMEDYEVMDATIAKYNQIVGMRNILQDLLEKTHRI